MLISAKIGNKRINEKCYGLPYCFNNTHSANQQQINRVKDGKLSFSLVFFFVFFFLFYICFCFSLHVQQLKIFAFAKLGGGLKKLNGAFANFVLSFLLIFASY